MNPDVIVVGSGPGGVHAALPLVEAGWQVALVDFGNRDAKYAPLIPKLAFSELRRTDARQHRYLLGDDFEGLPSGKIRVGAQLTPPRQYVHADVTSWMPIVSDTFSAMESLSQGGLGNAWGAGVFPFSRRELASMGLPSDAIESAYQRVAERIGVSGTRDDLLPFLGDCPSLMAGLRIDSNAQRIYDRYLAKRTRLNRGGFYVGQTRLAVCTEARVARGAYGYHDLDFWADVDRSVYRPRWTLDELRRHENFSYIDRRFAVSFRETDNGWIDLEMRHADSGETASLRTRRLILAAGTLGSTRIVLRSFGAYETRVPLLCNPYTYVPVLNLHSLGRPTRDERCSLAQLTAVYQPDENDDLVQTQFYSYRSLLTFKLMKEVPLGGRNALRALRLMMNALGILGVNHADRPTADKYCQLRRDLGGGPDQLAIEYRPSQEASRQAMHERAVLRNFRRLGCWPLKRIHPGHGSSIHYAGTLPISSVERELTCDGYCRLRGARGVYLADGSVFPWLPAKGLTFSIMANAHRVGQAVGEDLSRAQRSMAA